MSNADQPYAQGGYELMGAAFELHNVQGRDIGRSQAFRSSGFLYLLAFISVH